MNTINESTQKDGLSETGRKILNTLERAIPLMSNLQQERLLGLAEGLEYSKRDKIA